MTSSSSSTSPSLLPHPNPYPDPKPRHYIANGATLIALARIKPQVVPDISVAKIRGNERNRWWWSWESLALVQAVVFNACYIDHLITHLPPSLLEIASNACAIRAHY